MFIELTLADGGDALHVRPDSIIALVDHPIGTLVIAKGQEWIVRQTVDQIQDLIAGDAEEFEI